MSIYNHVTDISGGFGISGLVSSYGVALSGTGAQTTTIPATGSFILAFYAGWVRVKVYNGAGTTPTLTDVKITASDGTNTVTLASWHPGVAATLSSTAFADVLLPFILDISPAGGGSTGTLIQLGATSISVVTTLGGTSPAATMDIEMIKIP
jgi:hypothetical protein